MAIYHHYDFYTSRLLLLFEIPFGLLRSIEILCNTYFALRTDLLLMGSNLIGLQNFPCKRSAL